MPKKQRLTRAGNRWTEAGFNGFLVNTLRRATYRWPPKTDVLQAANVARGLYRCAMCGKDVPVTVPVEKKVKGKKKIVRKRNIVVDHIIPVVDVDKGFVSWDDFIKRMFVEPDGLQVLCVDCHKKKTFEEELKGRVDGRRKRKQKVR